MKRSQAVLAAAIAAVIAGVFPFGCSRPRLPPVPPPAHPFVRYPYVQAVTDSSGDVLWATERSTRDTLTYWIEGIADTIRIADPVPVDRHRARLRGLSPDAAVGYRVRAGGVATGVEVFRTAPVRGAPDSLDVLIWGDSGWGSEAQVDLARQMERLHDVALALHTGDIAYEDGSEVAFTQRYFRVYRRFLARVPVYPVPGNHDVRTDGGRPMDEAFVLPGAAETAGRRYYSFDWGQAHFIALDSNEEGGVRSDLRVRGRQYRWLVCDLSVAAADPRTRWIVVYLHHPPYSAGTGLSGHGSDRTLRDVLAPVFDRYEVDLVFSGHDHIYERSHPIRAGAVDTAGPGVVYVVTGGGGASQHWRGAGRAWHTAVSARAYEFVLLRIAPDRMAAEVVDRNGVRLDAFSVRPRRDRAASAYGEEQTCRREPSLRGSVDER